jgi:6,7-dimethyl-8-ribityllumazine synthase
MSDRYDDSRWQVRPQEPEAEGANGDPDAGLDEARENVLEDWPASPLLAATEASAGRALAEEPFQAESESEAAVRDELLEEPSAEPSAPELSEPEFESALSQPEPEAEPEPEPDPEPEPEIEIDAFSAKVADPAPVHETAEHAPGEFSVPPGFAVLEGVPEGRRRTVGVVVARFNGHVTTRLLETALDELDRAGVTPDAITIMPVPGAFELPLAAMALAKTRRFAAVVALGCVIRGDTPHFDYVASEAASGLQLAALETGVPVAFGLLTLDREEQADHRITKAAEAVRTALEMADLFANLRTATAT